MALLEDTVGGWGGGLLVGIGAALVGPTILNAAGPVVRPVAKTPVKGALMVGDGVRGLVAEATEQVSDLVAEVRAEGASGNGSEAGRHRPASHES